MPDIRLIECWLPIAEIGEEATRERRSMTALPPTYYLHVWWARRPLAASRAAILASLLPSDADRKAFLCTPLASMATLWRRRRGSRRRRGGASALGRMRMATPVRSRTRPARRSRIG